MGRPCPIKDVGLCTGASTTRLIRALNDVRSLPSSLRPLAYRIGASPIKMPGAQTPFRLGWIRSYASGFAVQPPSEPEIPAIEPPSSPDSSPRREPNLKRSAKQRGSRAPSCSNSSANLNQIPSPDKRAIPALPPQRKKRGLAYRDLISFRN